MRHIIGYTLVTALGFWAGWSYKPPVIQEIEVITPVYVDKPLTAPPAGPPLAQILVDPDPPIVFCEEPEPIHRAYQCLVEAPVR